MSESNQLTTSRRFKRKRSLSVPFFSILHRTPLYVKILSAQEDRPAPGFAKSADGTIPVCSAVDLETGEEGMLIVPAVVQRAFERCPDSYVGKCFELVAGEERMSGSGHTYRDVAVYEIVEGSDGS